MKTLNALGIRPEVIKLTPPISAFRGHAEVRICDGHNVQAAKRIVEAFRDCEC